MPSPPRAARRNACDVQFSDNVQEYPVWPDDPPVVVQGYYQPPSAPRLAARSLPGTPQAGPSTLQLLEEETEDTTYHCDDTARSSACARSTAHSHTMPTPSNSPATSTLTMRSSPRSSNAGSSPASSASSLTPSTSPTLPPTSTASDVCRELLRFPLDWRIRQRRFADVPRADFFRAHAFSSGRKCCTLSFQGVHPSDEWTVTVNPRSDGRSLTVEDVLARVDRELYRVDDGSGFYDGHPRLADARRERRERLHGESDERENVLRGIDFFSAEEHQCFLGLEQVSAPSGIGGALYCVRLGPLAR